MNQVSKENAGALWRGCCKVEVEDGERFFVSGCSGDWLRMTPAHENETRMGSDWKYHTLYFAALRQEVCFECLQAKKKKYD